MSEYFKAALDSLPPENLCIVPEATMELQRRVDRHKRWLTRREREQGISLPAAVWEFFADARFFILMERHTESSASMKFLWFAGRCYFSILSNEEVDYCIPVGMGENPAVLQLVEVDPVASHLGEGDPRALIWIADTLTDWVAALFRSAGVPF